MPTNLAGNFYIVCVSKNEETLSVLVPVPLLFPGGGGATYRDFFWHI